MGVGPVAAQDERCLEPRDPGEVIPIFGELIQLSQAMDQAGVEGKIDPSAAQVCQVDGQWQWRVMLWIFPAKAWRTTLPAQ